MEISPGGAWTEKPVGVAKALSPDFRVMIMDEPAATGKSSPLSSWQHIHDYASLEPRANEGRLTINIREG